MAGRSKGWRWVPRRGKRIAVIDFYFLDPAGRRRRYRKDASIPTATGATAEARRLMEFAAEHGFVEGMPTTEDHQEPEPETATPPTITIRDFVEGVFTETFMPGYKPSTKRRYRDLFHQGMLAAIGHLPIADFGPNEYRQYAATLLARGVTLKGPLNLVKTVLRPAEASEVISVRPRLPKLFKEPKKLPKGPRLEEIAEQIAASPPWLQVALGLAGYAGLRSGEIRALQVRHIDFVERRIHVELAMSDDTETTTKSDDERWAPIPEPLLPLLMEAKRNKLPTARLVTNREGTTPNRQNLLNALRNVQRRHKLKKWNVHSFRHAFCSHMSRNKVAIETIRRMVGHTNLATTARYLHADVADIHDAMELFTASRPSRK